MPYLAILFVDAILVFSSDDYDMMMGEVKIACFHFGGVGIVHFLSTIVSACASGVLSEGMASGSASRSWDTIKSGPAGSCVSLMSASMFRRRRRAWRGHVSTIGQWPYKIWVSFGRCRPGACAFGAELVAAMQNLLDGVCWLPGRLLRGFEKDALLLLWGRVGWPRLSSCPVNAAMQVGYGETAQQAAVMYRSIIRVPSFLLHSAVFLDVCLLSAAAH